MKMHIIEEDDRLNGYRIRMKYFIGNEKIWDQWGEILVQKIKHSGDGWCWLFHSSVKAVNATELYT